MRLGKVLNYIKSFGFSRANIAIGIVFIFLTLLTILPRVLSLSGHWATDEDLWMQRSRNFFFAINSGQFEDTFVAYHPGVTTCWLGTPAIWHKSKDYFKTWFYSDQFLSPEMLARVRFSIALAAGVIILVMGLLIYRLFGKLLSCICTLFLAIEPFLLSESRRAHTDVLTALFLFLALLLWLYYLEGETRKPRRDIVLSGICFGLACLTKSHAGVIIVFLPFMLIWYHYQCHIHWSELLLSVVLWTASTLLTVGIVWPYLWTVKLGNLPLSPCLFVGSGVLLLWSWRKFSQETHFTFSKKEILLIGCGVLVLGILTMFAAKVVISRMYNAVTTSHGLPCRFLGEIRRNPGPLFFPVMWFVWSGLLTLPLILFALYRSFQLRLKEAKAFRVAVVIFLFILFYMVGLSYVSKKISRYIVIILPSISFLTALGAMQLAQLVQNKKLRYCILAIIFILQAVPILSLYPNYRAYHHPLLSARWIEENTSSITGAGLDLAADYLNAKPDAERLRVRHTWFCKEFAHYFVGEARIYYNYDPSAPNFDYDLEYLYDKQIQSSPTDTHIKPTNNPNGKENKNEVLRELEHIVNINGIDYVWIYRVVKPDSKKDIKPTSE